MIRNTVTRLVVILSLAGLAAWAAPETKAPAPAPVKSQAEPVKLKYDPIRQLGRGLSNVITGVVEVPVNMHAVSEDSGDVAGATWGLVRGVERFVVREGVGVFELVTFPAGWGPIIEPEFPFEPVKTTDWKLNSISYDQLQ